MLLKNCHHCGRLFQSMQRDICPDCFREEELLLRQTREYLRTCNKRRAYIAEVVEHVAVDPKIVEKWIREKKIDTVSIHESKEIKTCPICGRLVQENKKFCNNCTLNRISRTAPDERNEIPEETSISKKSAPKVGMHYKIVK